MKFTSRLILLALSCGLSFLMADEASLRGEFKEITERRDQRSMLLDYLKKTEMASESRDGTLEQAPGLDMKAKTTIAQENADRLRLFEIISELEGGSAESVGQAFAKRMGVAAAKPTAPSAGTPQVAPPATDANQQIVTVLRIHGSNTVGAELTPELVRGFLQKMGYKDISSTRKGVETFILFKGPGETNFSQVEIKAHGSSTAFGETDENKAVGLANGHADIGMSSRQIKPDEAKVLEAQGLGSMYSAACEYPIALDGVAVLTQVNNPVKQLTAKQIAAVFSGSIRNWSELGGSNEPIRIFARDKQSGTWDTFESKVLKPSGLGLSEDASCFEDGDLLVRNVASTAGSIGFVGLANVNSTVRGMAVQAGEGTRGLQATRLTVKSMDYPLARLLYFYLPVNAPTIARDFVRFAMSDEGQSIADKVGMVGQGRASTIDLTNADTLRQALLSDEAVPGEYRELIARSDRRDTQANIRFASGEMQPDINSMNNIDRLTSFLAEPSNSGARVILIGFTDNLGSAATNKSLSVKRAEAIAEILRSKGVSNLEVTGFGKAMPVADNETPEGRSQNRRVEIWLQR